MNLQLIKKYYTPNTILDIGANIGQFHLECKKIFPNSYIFSIEASKECEAHLKSITDDYLITLLAKDNEIYDFYKLKDIPTNTGNSIYRENTHFYSDENTKIEKLHGTKLDDLFTDDSVFDLIKIDTQGSELDIITGGLNLCKRARGILLEVSYNQYNHDSPLYDDVNNFMNKIGFVETEIIGREQNHGANQADILYIRR